MRMLALRGKQHKNRVWVDSRTDARVAVGSRHIRANLAPVLHYHVPSGGPRTFPEVRRSGESTGFPAHHGYHRLRSRACLHARS